MCGRGAGIVAGELSDEQVEQFLSQGFVVVRGCFSREAAAEYTASVWTRLGYEEHTPSTWTEPSVHMPHHRRIDVATFAPRAWQAMLELVGGTERVDHPYTWNDAFIVNLWEGGDRPWEPASPSSPGWHKDGDFFRHFLDSPEQGLLTLVLWTDVRHQGGPTFVAADSVGPVARFLAEHPEGAYPPKLANELRQGTGVGPDPVFLPYDDLISQCTQFVEATGEVGDVYLLHPFILHAKAQNTLRVPRIITNPPLTLAEPMCLDRPDGDYSLVERAVLRGLGVDRFAFTAAPRERLVPQREVLQQTMLREERERLAAAGLA